MSNAAQPASRPDHEIPDDFVSRSDGLRLRSFDEAKRQATFVASTDSIDSYDERVTQDWNLDRYKKNPVVLYAHDRWGRLPIGKSVHCEVESGQLVCTIQFAKKESNPEAEQVFQLVREDILRAVSVGFRPHSYRYEMQDDREILVLSQNELYEISVVPIPANPDALAKMKQRAPRALRNDNPASKRAEEIDMATEQEKALEKANADLAERDATILRLKGELADRDKQLADVRASLDTVRTELTKASNDRDAAKNAADEATDKLIDFEVSALVGKKITPAEKDGFVKLRKADKALFDEMMEKRPALKLDEQITKSEEAKASPATGADELGDIVADVEKTARS